MSSKPETLLTKRVHNGLPKNIYREKTANSYRSGPPDYYYETSANCIAWIEYKIWNRSFVNLKEPIEPKIIQFLNEGNRSLTVHQKEWLVRASMNGVSCGVIIGSLKESHLYITAKCCNVGNYTGQSLFHVEPEWDFIEIEKKTGVIDFIKYLLGQ